MTAPRPPSRRPAPILPVDKHRDRPLLWVMSVMSFLAVLTLIIASHTIKGVNAWQSELSDTVSLQIMIDRNDNRDEVIATVTALIRADMPNANLNVLSQDRAQTLLEPWLGNAPFPKDIPLPLIITLENTQLGTRPEHIQNLQTQFEAAGLAVVIANQNQWAQTVYKTGRWVQFLLFGIVILILTTTLSIARFATHSAMATQQKIVSVLDQIGTKDRHIARLFVLRFLKTGLWAGFIGAVAALVFSAVIQFILRGNETILLFANARLHMSDIIYALILALIFGCISGASAGFRSLSLLRAERRLI